MNVIAMQNAESLPVTTGSNRQPERPARRAADVVAWLRVRAERSRLDGELAEGCGSESSDLHALRAHQLTTLAVCAKAAASLRHVVDDAEQPYAVLTPVRLHWSPVLVSLRQAEVRACRDGLLGLAQRLDDHATVNPCGVARALVLLTDGTGPLYHDAPKRRLAETIWGIADGLAPCPVDEDLDRRADRGERVLA